MKIGISLIQRIFFFLLFVVLLLHFLGILDILTPEFSQQFLGFDKQSLVFLGVLAVLVLYLPAIIQIVIVMPTVIKEFLVFPLYKLTGEKKYAPSGFGSYYNENLADLLKEFNRRTVFILVNLAKIVAGVVLAALINQFLLVAGYYDCIAATPCPSSSQLLFLVASMVALAVSIFPNKLETMPNKIFSPL